MSATQPPTATHTQPPTAPGPPQSCCSEGTEACTQSGGMALSWPLSQPWGHRQLGHPRLQWLESPVHLGWTGSFGQSHTLPAYLPLSSPSSVLGRPPRHQGPRWREGRLYPGGGFPNPCTARRHCDHPNFCLCGLCTHPGLSRNGLRPSLFHRRCRDNSWGSGEGAPTGPSLASVTLTTTGTGPFYQTAARPPWTRTSAVPPLPTAWGAQAERLWRLAG